jgi:hypothetical protein
MILALVTAAVSVPAQQAIVFSKPADTAADTDKADSSQPGTSHLWGAGAYSAPRQLFHDYSPSLPAPAPQPLIINSASTQDALNKRKNWTLLTPGQIMGVQTPEQILATSDTKSSGKLSLEEQFLQRESRPAASTATNGRSMVASWRNDNNPFGGNKDGVGQNPFFQPPNSLPGNQDRPDSSRTWKQLLNPMAGNLSGGDRKQESAWNNFLGQSQTPLQTPDQLAGMERFRALMEPSSPPDKVQTPGRLPVAAAPAVDPFLQKQPQFNPAGRPVAALEDNIGRPKGLQPLPGVSGVPITTPKTKPTWQAQLPPWMQSGPQPHDLNRNF